MDKKYEINFVDERFGISYGITIVTTENGYIHNVEVTRNPNSGCASRTREIPKRNIEINELEKEILR